MANLAQPAGQANLVVGGRVFTDLANLKILSATGSAAGQRATFRDGNDSAGYAVTAGKTLRILAVKLLSIGTGATNALLAQTDNDVGLVSVTAFTNAVYERQDGTYGCVSIAGTVNTSCEQAIEFDVAATKYLSMVSGTTAGTAWVCYVYGYEV